MTASQPETGFIAAIANAIASLADIAAGGPQKRERMARSAAKAAELQYQAAQLEQETSVLLEAARARRAGELPSWLLPAGAVAVALYLATRER